MVFKVAFYGSADRRIFGCNPNLEVMLINQGNSSQSCRKVVCDAGAAGKPLLQSRRIIAVCGRIHYKTRLDALTP